MTPPDLIALRDELASRLRRASHAPANQRGHERALYVRAARLSVYRREVKP